MTVDLVANMRRPKLKREVSDRGTASGHRGSGEGMRAKDWRVNTGDPSSCVGKGLRNRRSVRTRAGRAGKSERPIRALKRVTIAEQRGLAFEGQVRRNKSASDWR